MTARVGRLLAAAALAVIGVGMAESGALHTDLSKALIPVDEIVSGGPSPDGIPAIDRPRFVEPGAADAWLKPKEPVLALEVNGDARAYPLQILMWHEIVNDTVQGRAVAVTYCPLCNSGLVFDRTVDGVRLDFGTSGKLYKSDLLMYDRQSHSLWTQIEGRAVVGERAGTRLAPVPANTIAYEDWKAAYPGGKVLSRDTGHVRSYGRTPYASYDHPDSFPFLLRGDPDRRRSPKERVVGVVIEQAARAYPWPILAKEGVVHDTVGGQPLVIFYRPGALSALDEAEMHRSRAIGATAVFSPVVAGKMLTFEIAPDGFRDRPTGSLWNVVGHGVRGPLAGKRLRAIVHIDVGRLPSGHQHLRRFATPLEALAAVLGGIRARRHLGDGTGSHWEFIHVRV